MNSYTAAIRSGLSQFGWRVPLTRESKKLDYDLRAPDLYLNRELTWLSFNRRVLHEAQDARTPLLERLKFLAIVSANLDEFFMKRIGGLKHQVVAGVEALTVDGRTPQGQIEECHTEIRALVGEITAEANHVLTALRQHGISLLNYEDLNDSERLSLREHYERDVLPLVTPLSLDSAHPFPLISSLSLNLVVSVVNKPSGKRMLVRVKVPASLNNQRFVRVGDSHNYVPLEQIMAHNLDLLFPGCDILNWYLFRVTRNASSAWSEEKADDLLAMVQAELRDRKFAPTVRLEVSQVMPQPTRILLASQLGIDRSTDIFEVQGLHGLSDLIQLAKIECPKLHDAPHAPVPHAQLPVNVSVFEAIREQGTILLHHPYESFADTVERFVTEASRDPDVLAMKATLYRTSSSTKIVDSLIEAAESGKEVAVVIELKARFDEAANVRWAQRLEEAGVHVSYGADGLKTHCKALLVVRREEQGLKRYVHIGTGNYHADTAMLYSDVGLLSCDEDLGHDVADLLNALTSGRDVGEHYRKILTAPKVMKKVLISKIEREIKQHAKASAGRIRLKTNALEDPDIVAALYRAGQAGVKVELMVRDTCRLRPGLAGLSETITVISAVGRFLEHARIYHFHNGGEDEYFLGSADLMQRNLEHRVEILAPVEKPELKVSLGRLLDTHLNDRRHTWLMQSDGSYVQRRPALGEPENPCQETFITRATAGCLKTATLDKVDCYFEAARQT